MNTQTINSLPKTLRALSVLFMSLSVLVIAVRLSFILGVHTVPGVHIGSMIWSSCIHSALILILAGAVLFCCYLFSRREKRGWLATLLLWATAIVAGAYAALLIFSLASTIFNRCVA
jgi:uncharacterized BrkB/YihY/UPF0761 family membrane protein